MIYTLTLNPALDYVLTSPELRFGEINRASAAAFRFGGKGINVSVMLSRLGVESTALGFAGGLTGEKLAELVRAEGVRCDLTELAAGETRVNVKLRSSRELDANAPGPSVGDADLAALLEKLACLGRGDVLVFSGSVPPEAPPDTAGRIFAAVERSGAALVADTTGAALEATLKHRPFLVKPNHVELGDLFGESADTEDKVADLARRLLDAGAKNVLVSRAEKGAMLFCGDGAAYSVGVVPGVLEDSACCGDAAVAGFLAGLERTGDFAEALRLGAACGNATAFCDGLADEAAVSEIYEKLFVERR